MTLLLIKLARPPLLGQAWAARRFREGAWWALVPWLPCRVLGLWLYDLACMTARVK